MDIGGKSDTLGGEDQMDTDDGPDVVNHGHRMDISCTTDVLGHSSHTDTDGSSDVLGAAPTALFYQAVLTSLLPDPPTEYTEHLHADSSRFSQMQFFILNFQNRKLLKEFVH